VTQLTVLTTQVQRYERFEVSFQVARAYQNPFWPFDANHSSGVPAGAGISVDALFSRDGWQTTRVQPAFYDQPFSYQVRDGRDHLVPDGQPRWAVRLAPPQAGAWEYRLRVTDAHGTAYYPQLDRPALQFSVGESSTNPYTRGGFLRQRARTATLILRMAPFVGGFQYGFASSQAG
jgi:hypothetical protein